MPIPIVDFFAGPGGLGEGFSSFRDTGGRSAFQIALSVEKDAAARKTLLLRSFTRQFPHDELPSSYYRYLRGEAGTPYDLYSRAEWNRADHEALLGALGDPAVDDGVDSRLARLKLRTKEWVLIGGPPCQAYSLVGRSRNAGMRSYRAEEDERHFLYRHYLRVLDTLRPPIFVFENVKGILSSRVDGAQVFHKILGDLSEPSIALHGRSNKGVRYRIRSLSTEVLMEPGADPSAIEWRDFLVRAEKLGAPQARHRVILIGVRSDLDPAVSERAKEHAPPSLDTVIGGLPRLRSGLSRDDSLERWRKVVIDAAGQARRLLRGALPDRTTLEIDRVCAVSIRSLPRERVSSAPTYDQVLSKSFPLLATWYQDQKLHVTLNHEARGHMDSDIKRYMFCSAYGALAEYSPTARVFPRSIAPDHESWGTGAFADRFRVQVRGRPATTITSHIAKDGHYFIHYDPTQCRSLTVREAARAQTFPDNYFFEGNRTQQYTQVGNAVPPFVAREIARIVWTILRP